MAGTKGVWHPDGPVVSIERDKGKTKALWIGQINVKTVVGWSLHEKVGDVARISMEFLPSDIVIRGDQQKGDQWADVQIGEYGDYFDPDGDIVGGGLRQDPWES